MIVDASAVIAILFAENDADRFVDTITNADKSRISAVNYWEAAVRLDRAGGAPTGRKFDEFMIGSGIVVESVTHRQAELAREARRRFGKGSGHKAQLNLGDCFAYALAMELDEPLLFKGNDFSKTDVIAAL